MFELYIDNNLVDVNDSLKISINKKITDLSNPSAVNNSWSQTITLDGTSTNNKLFGNIYDFGRITESGTTLSPYTGMYFDQSIKTPFKLYENSQLIMEGYIKLESIDVKDSSVISYSIKLFGLLGQWFFELSKKPLQDLFLKYDNAGNITGDTLEHIINYQSVLDTFSYIPVTGGTNWKDFIGYNLSNQGLYENFNNQNTYWANGFIEKGSGAGRGEQSWPNSIGDRFMSYKQKPHLKVGNVINRIIQTSPYTVDTDFLTFDRSINETPYFNETIFTLPNISNYTKPREAFTGIKIDLYDKITTNSNAGPTNGLNMRFGIKLHMGSENLDVPPTFDVSNTLNMSLRNLDDGKICKITNINSQNVIEPYYTTVDNISVKINIDCVLDLSLAIRDTSNPDGYVNWAVPILMFTRLYDISSKESVISDKIKIYSNNVPFNNMDNNSYRYDIYFDASRSTVVKPNLVRIYYKDSNGNVTDLGLVSNGARLNSSFTFSNYPQNGKLVTYIQFEFPEYIGTGFSWCTSNNSKMLWRTQISNSSYCELNGKETIKVISGSIIGSLNLIPKELTQLDFLLGYCKLFGLQIEDDYLNNKIIFKTRNEYFKDKKIIDLTEKIDNSSVKIIPRSFENKYFTFNYKKMDKDIYSEIYKNFYNQNYGEIKLNTGTDFNVDNKDIFDKQIFIPSIVSQELLEFEKTTNYDPKNKDGQTTGENINALPPGKDIKILPTTYISDIDKRKPSKNYGMLLFDNDRTAPYTLGGYYVTDLTGQMKADGNLCHNCTDYEAWKYIGNGRNLSTLQTTFPLYTQLMTSGGTKGYPENYSTDIFRPNEIYTNQDYPTGITIYDRYWKDFMSDLYNVDTKVISVKAKMNSYERNNLKLSDFVYYNGSLFAINKFTTVVGGDIEDVTMELVTVKNITNYTNL